MNELVVTGFIVDPRQPSASSSASRESAIHSMVGDARGDYYGESSGSFMVKEFSEYEQLEEIVKLASQPIPERPDGIVVVAKFSSFKRPECTATEAEYERLARNNPATIFLRCMEEYENAHILLGQVDVQVWPTHDIFYGGNRVARIQGSSIAELEEALQRYQFQNSKFDLFSEMASQKWGDGTPNKAKMNSTPRTTNRFVPGYDWNKKTGAFDEAGQKAQTSFEEMFGNWIPNIDDDDDQSTSK
ncbi:hypothetical protein IV203_023587 [Nitzschia inconspicua]|uniref:Uncharacterized protein n=1 Tax=Nitzschia inconspicua TaxID=303405 RepID=A0A9K3KE56_9STRA|nr:hypothetical protein IV203_023587 [Nitzschia inconspicua]